MTDIAALRNFIELIYLEDHRRSELLAAFDELEALRERFDVLRERQLRQKMQDVICGVCGKCWSRGAPEIHTDGCVARPEGR